MEHDSPTLLFPLGCEYLRSATMIRLGLDWLSRLVVAARDELGDAFLGGLIGHGFRVSPDDASPTPL